MAEASPILIAGGGIGGLAAALGLARKGIGRIVLEKAPVLGEIDAGIQLGPNAFHAFDYLGVGDAARAMAVFIDRLRLMDAMGGEEITHIDLGEAFRRRFGNPYAVMHRGDLYGVFLRACCENPLVEPRNGSQVVAYEQDGATVSALMANGEHAIGRALIGADGLWSNIRRQLVAAASRASLATPPTAPSSPLSGCPRICVGTQPPSGPGRNATSCTTRCRAGICSTWSSPTTTTRPSRSPASLSPSRR
jgi:2-polyprenyl-6-methoxyphenol hydroxylase-like FAD-dependent oxidoreductase